MHISYIPEDVIHVYENISKYTYKLHTKFQLHIYEGIPFEKITSFLKNSIDKNIEKYISVLLFSYLEFEIKYIYSFYPLMKVNLRLLSYNF